MKLLTANLMQTIKKNASNLFESGYRVELIAGDGLFCVFNLCKPSSYTVETRGAKVCECACFAQHGVCKHTEGITLLIQAQICSYYLRLEQGRAEFRKFRGTWEEKQRFQAFLDKLDNAAFELESALGDLTGTAEFYMPRRLTGYVPEASEQAGRRVA